MKKISVVTPVYNEEENLPVYYHTITDIMQSLPDYEYEILLVDNCSVDNTRMEIRKLCEQDTHVKAIFNMMNYGFHNSVYHGLKNSDGDCTILVNCDFQDPPELIPGFVREWEKGYKVVLGIKTESHEKRLMQWKRKFYYRVVDLLSEKKQVLNHTGFGLYDKKFIEILRQIHEPAPYLKELVSSFSFQKKEITYVQNARQRGEGSTRMYVLYDDAMTGLTKSSKLLMRSAVFAGIFIGLISLLFAVWQVVLKLMHPQQYASGIAFIAVGVFVLSSIQLFFIGILGEYVLSINIKTNQRPAVFEEERINFKKADDQDETGTEN